MGISVTPDDDVISRIVQALKAAQESAFADLRLAVASDQHKGEYNFLKDNYLGGISKGLEQAVEIIESLPTAAPVVPNHAEIRAIVDEQAEDEGLWGEAANIVEAHLQQELRRLHAAIENTAPVVPSEPLEWFSNDLPHPFWYAQDEDESGLFSIVKGRTGTLGADMWTLMLGDITLFGAVDPEYLKGRAQQIQDAIENASPVTQWTRECPTNHKTPTGQLWSERRVIFPNTGVVYIATNCPDCGALLLAQESDNGRTN